MKSFLHRHGWTIFNLYIFVNFAGFCAYNAWKTWHKGGMGYVEWAFVVQNVVLVGVILLRPVHRAIDRTVWHQVVALAAFLSGMLFMGQPACGGPVVVTAAKVVTVMANVLGIATLLNLGRSFGILIACRTVKTQWLYSVVRHPMYGTDILLRVGFLIGHFSVYTALVFAVSSGCYVVRALLEEKFLAATAPEYAEYMRRVRWRFLPGIF